MSDIDFDELDKAVNTLMSDVPKAEPPKTDDIKTLTIKSTLSDTAIPSLANLDSTLAAVNGVTTIPTAQPPAVNRLSRPSSASLASRRTGRFMDVVHPSADMKTMNKTPSRQGVSVEPAGQFTSDKPTMSAAPQQATETSPVLLEMNKTVSSAPLTTITSERDSSENDWPDPLDMSGYEPEPSTVIEQPIEAEVIATPVTPVVSIAPVAPEEPETPTEAITMPTYEDPQPLTSPFITDAKVEKRPLGGAPVEEPGRAPVLGVLAKEDEDVNVSDPADQLPATPPEVETQLPPELQSDLMAIEAAGEMPMTNTSPAPKAAPVAVPAQQKVAQPAPLRPSEPAQASSGPTSIPQQYHESPSTSDEPNGSIYDTASYHQPLAHPAKSKPSWLWIVWIVLLLLVGGGGAVALYYLGVI